MPIVVITRRKLIIKEPKATTAPWEPHATLDNMAKHLITQWPNLLVPWYLMTSWTYYCRDVSLVSDGFYGDICETLNAHWEVIEHMHKHLVDREAVATGTGYYVNSEVCPGMTRAGASHLAKVEWGIHIRVND